MAWRKELCFFNVWFFTTVLLSCMQLAKAEHGSACDGQAELIDLSFTQNGSIYSPGYPNNYSNNENCQWLIKAPYGKRILIYFTTFDVEDDDQCSYDSVNIFDGQNSFASLLLKSCGSSLPPPVYSSGRYIFMQFTSDESVSHQGFVAHYIATNSSSNITPPPTLSPTTNPACHGQTQTIDLNYSQNGSIFSPGYPNNYGNDENCQWLIEAPYGERILIYFTTFDVEDSYDGQCSYDSVNIFDGQNSFASLLSKSCGSSLPPPVYSSGRYIYMQFTSDGSASYQGFVAHYIAINSSSGITPPPTLTPTTNPACHGQTQTIDLSYSQNGSIFSPGYPNNYDINENCQWLIEAPYGERILIYFTTFDVEDHAQCSYDSVNIFDGQNNNASLLLKSCGSNLPPPVYSSGRYIYMQFTSDSIVSGKGFVAHYRALNSSSECTENVNQSFGRLDISYTSKFVPYCNWIVENAGIPQAVAVVSIHQMNFSDPSEYVKFVDGNGTEVFALHGWDSAPFNKSVQQIPFEESTNITIQVSLINSLSYVKIDYGILKHRLSLASILVDWNVAVVNKTAKSVRIIWSQPTNLISSGIGFYVALARKTNSSSKSTGEIVAEGTTASEITGLAGYTEYNVVVVAVDGDGIPFKSADVLVMTDEGVPSRAPNGVRVLSIGFTSDLQVEWDPLPQDYANGKLLGYTIYYIELNHYGGQIKSVNTSAHYPTQFTLKGLTPANEYLVAVAAFTSQGAGPLSFFVHAITGCSTTLNETFGQIELTSTSYDDLRCNWEIQSAGIHEAVAFISVQELNLHYCSEFVKIINGNGTEVLYHLGCDTFAPEILADVPFGLSKNISIKVYTQSYGSSIKMKFAILKKGLTAAIPVSGWNVTIYDLTSFSFTLQWTMLNSINNHYAAFYIVEVKSIQGTILAVETVPGNATTTVIKGLIPSTKYRVGVFGVDSIGQPYKSLESVTTTSKVFCGSRPSFSRIVGGTEAPVNSWPWQVMVTDNSGNQFCGGSLVDPYWVVTAAHCMVGETPSSVKIRLGAHYRTSESIGTEQYIGVAEIIMHEYYKTPLSESNDIALIKLASPADLGEGVGLVCLPDTVHQLPLDNLNKKCWITGWGTLSSGGSQPNTLQQASVPLVSKQRCMNVYPGDIDDSMLCAGFDEGGVDTCQGDSGGPLVYEFNGTWYLEGVTSWGYGCAESGYYGVYAKVRNFKSWLSKNMYTVVVPPSVSPPNQSSSALAWCNFEHGLCSGWNQLSSDDFDWTLASGGTPSSSTGPSHGQGGSGKYMYIEASSPRKPGENAKLVVTVPNNGKQSCLSFYYHMYGASAGFLNVYSGNIKVFSASGNQGNDWLIVERNLYLVGVVTFEGITGSSYTGDVAIDQVKIIEGSCPVSCSFDAGLESCFGWSQSKSDVFDWKISSGPTPPWSTRPSSDVSGTGKYMYVDSSTQSRGKNAKLQLAVTRSNSSSCLTFYYHMYGSDMGTLIVFNGNVKIFTKSGNQGNLWRKGTRTVHLSDVLTFEGIVSSYRSRAIAIDNVTVSKGDCPVPIAFCDFDEGLCEGWRLSGSGVFNWTRHRGPTRSPSTGPFGDHTSGSGYYMYIDTSSPRVDGDNAKLEVSVLANGEVSCLTFYYHMYGATMGTLTVFSGDTVVFNASGNHGYLWTKVEKTIHLDKTVTFEGIRGTSSTGDLAIDDVLITNGSCQVHTSTPAFSTASTFAPSWSSALSTFIASTAKPSMSSGSLSFKPSTAKPLLSSGSSSFKPSAAKPLLSTDLSTFSPSTVKPSLVSGPSKFKLSTAKPLLPSDLSTFNPSTAKFSLSSVASTFKPSMAKPFLFSDPSTLSLSTRKPSLSSNPWAFKPSTPKSSLSLGPSSFKPSTAKTTLTSDSSMFDPSTHKPSLSLGPSTSNPSTAKPSFSSDLSTFSPSTVKPSLPSWPSSLKPSTAKLSLSSDLSPLIPSTAKPWMLNASTHNPSLSLDPSTLKPSTAKLSFSSDLSTFSPSTTRPSLSSGPSTFKLSTSTPSLSSDLFIYTLSTAKPSLSSWPSPSSWPSILINSSIAKPSLSSGPSTFKPSTVKSTLSSGPSTFNLSTVRPLLSLGPSTFEPSNVKASFSSYLSTFSPSTVKPFLSSGPPTFKLSTHKLFLSSGLSAISPFTVKPSLSSGKSTFKPSTAKPSLPSYLSTFTLSTVKSSLSSGPSTLKPSIAKPLLSSELSKFIPSSLKPTLSLGASMLIPSTHKPSLSSGPTTFKLFTNKPSLSSDLSTFSPSTAKISLSSYLSTLSPTTAKPPFSSEPSTFKSSTHKPSLSSGPSTFTPSTAKPSLSSYLSTLSPSTAKPSFSSEPSMFIPSTYKPSLYLGTSTFKLSTQTFSPSTVKLSLFLEPTAFKSSTQKPPLSSGPPTYKSSTAEPALGSDLTTLSSPTAKPSLSLVSSTLNPFTHKSSWSSGPLPSLSRRSSSGFPDSTPTTKTFQPATSETPLTPRTPSLEETQDSIMLEVQDLDIKKWNEIDDNFKREVARIATDYCAADENQCQFASVSSRRKRSSNNMVFTSDMVNILPGYPKQSPDNPSITLLAFYLQHSQGIVSKSVLKAIVESDVSSLEGSIGGTILRVQSSPTRNGNGKDDGSDEESNPMSAIIGAAVGDGLLLVIVGAAIVFVFKRRNRFKRNAEETANNNYNNNANNNDSGELEEHCYANSNVLYVSSDEIWKKGTCKAIEMKRTCSPGIAPDKELEDHCYSKNNVLHVSSDKIWKKGSCNNSASYNDSREQATEIKRTILSGMVPVRELYAENNILYVSSDEIWTKNGSDNNDANYKDSGEQAIDMKHTCLSGIKPDKGLKEHCHAKNNVLYVSADEIWKKESC
ncbi:uncharacterized protein LOC144648698 isoform X1 [Oculina patagonica]